MKSNIDAFKNTKMCPSFMTWSANVFEQRDIGKCLF